MKRIVKLWIVFVLVVLFSGIVQACGSLANMSYQEAYDSYKEAYDNGYQFGRTIRQAIDN